MNNKCVKIAGILAIFVLVIALFKNQVVKSVVEMTASRVLGTKVQIDGLALGVLKPAVRVQGFRVYNPQGFPKGILLDVAEVVVEYDLPALLRGKLYFPLIVFDLKEMVVVKNKEGILNVDALKVVPKEEGPSKEKEKFKPLDMKIDVLTLNVGKVIFKDYSQGEEPVVQGYDVRFKNKTYRNIKSAQQIAALIMIEAMKPTAIQGAKVYGAAALLGVGFLPAGIAGTLIGKDSGRDEFSVDYKKAFGASRDILKKSGEFLSGDEQSGILKANVNGNSVTVRVTKRDVGKTEIIVSARKFMIPQPEAARGILYQIGERLK